MKRLALLVLGVLWLTPAHAQSVTKLCFPTVVTGSGKTSCQNVTSTNPLPTTATLSAAGGVNVTVTNTVGVDAVSGGNLLTALAAGTGTTGAAVPASALYAALNVSGNLTGLTMAHMGVGATGSAAPANGNYLAGLASGATGGLLAGVKTCDLHAIYTGTDNGSKTLVAGVSGRKTYICGYLLTTGGTATTLTLKKGTDADCATSSGAISAPYALLANDKVGVMSAFWNGFVTATNADYVCIDAGAGNQHTAEIWYTIQ